MDWCHAFVLSQPGNTAIQPYYLIDFTDQYEGLVDGFPQLFSPVPVQITKPKIDDTGSQEMSIIWCGISGEAKEFLDLAITRPDCPILCRYSIYILGDRNPQLDPWLELSLTNITMTLEAVSATATRADILNRSFPTEVYRLDRFPGLRRQ